MLSRIAWITLVAVISGASGLYFMTLDNGHLWSDFAGYLAQVDSLRMNDFEGYQARFGYLVRESDQVESPVAYPWGFPILLYLWSEVVGHSMVALKSINVVFFAIYLIAVGVFTWRHLSSLAAILVVVGCAFFPRIGYMIDLIGADIAFLASTGVFFIVLSYWYRSKGCWKNALYGGMAAGVVAGISLSFRSAGFVLALLPLAFGFFTILAGFIREIRECDPVSTKCVSGRSGLLVLGGVLTLITSFTFDYVIHIPFPTVSYNLEDHNLTNLSQIADNLQYYWNWTLGLFPDGLLGIMLMMMTLIALMGGLINAHRDDAPVVLFAIAYGMLLLILPWQQGIRYMLPLVFPVVFILSRAMDAVSGMFPNTHQKVRAVVFLLLISLFLPSATAALRSAVYVAKEGRIDAPGPWNDRTLLVLDRLAESTPSTSVVAFPEPRLMIYRTGLFCVYLTDEARIVDVDYVLTMPDNPNAFITREALQSKVEEGIIVEVWNESGHTLYAVKQKR